MKRTVSLLLALILLCAAAPAVSDGFDLSAVTKAAELFRIDEAPDRDVAFVETVLQPESLAFSHALESAARYSGTRFDMIVMQYGTPENRWPVFRMNLTFCADDFQNIDAVTFTVDGKEFTFTGIGDPEWRTRDGMGVVERLLIKFDFRSLPFLAAMEAVTGAAGRTAEALQAIHIPMILHGDTDIAAELTGDAIVDFDLISRVYQESNGLQYIGSFTGTDMTAEALPSPAVP